MEIIVIVNKDFKKTILFILKVISIFVIGKIVLDVFDYFIENENVIEIIKKVIFSVVIILFVLLLIRFNESFNNTNKR